MLASDEGTATWFLDTLMTVKASRESTGDAFALLEGVYPPGFAPPPHIHHAEDEAFYILEGQASFQCGDRTWQVTTGGFVFLPRDIVHGFRIESVTPTRMLQFTTPAGLERFFLEMGEPARALTLPPPRPPDVAKLRAYGLKYNFETVGPPPTQ